MEPRATHIGRYQILEPLGRGAMGIVYKAQDPTIQRLVAIKTISQLTAEDESTQEFRTRLAIEAQAAGRLSHPNIVTIFDVGQTDDDHTPFVVMEYLAGPSLHKKLAGSGGKLPWQEALKLGRDLARALHYAHAQGIIHRDIKPSNILFTEDGIPKIADFGIAHLNLSEATLPGHIVGTPAYMSPEQLSGEPIDGRSDLFSLGVMLYTTLTGHRPFQGNSAMTVSFKVVNGIPVPVSALDCALPPDIDYVLLRLLAKHPSDRYADGEELALDLDDVLVGQPPRTRSGIFLAPHPTHSSTNLRVARFSQTSVSRRSSTKLPVAPPPNSRRNPLTQILAGSTAALALILSGMVGLEAIKNHLGAPAIAAHADAQPAAPLDEAGAPVAAPVSPAQRSASAQRTAGSQNLSTSQRPASTQSAPLTPSGSSPETAASSPASSTPLIMRSSATSPGAAPAPNHSATKSAVPSALTLEVHHHFADGKLSLWIDDRLAFSTDLRGENRKRLLVFNSVKGYESAVLPVPQGTHGLRIRVTSSSYDQSTSVTTTFSSHREQTLRITCISNPAKLQATFN